MIPTIGLSIWSLNGGRLIGRRCFGWRMGGTGDMEITPLDLGSLIKKENIEATEIKNQIEELKERMEKEPEIEAKPTLI